MLGNFVVISLTDSRIKFNSFGINKIKADGGDDDDDDDEGNGGGDVDVDGDGNDGGDVERESGIYSAGM